MKFKCTELPNDNFCQQKLRKKHLLRDLQMQSEWNSVSVLFSVSAVIRQIKVDDFFKDKQCLLRSPKNTYQTQAFTLNFLNSERSWFEMFCFVVDAFVKQFCHLQSLHLKKRKFGTEDVISFISQWGKWIIRYYHSSHSIPLTINVECFDKVTEKSDLFSWNSNFPHQIAEFAW